MGIFGNDRNGPVIQADDTGSATTDHSSVAGGAMPAQPVGNDSSMQQSVDDLMSQTAPQIADQPSEESSDYIMTDPQVPEPDSAHQDPPAEPINVSVEPSVATPQNMPSDGDDDLASIKQQALQQLSPLVSHLDQSPEEKFHTTMMMLQATDDQSLVKVAYQAAQAITDEKAKAQALLDIVNEINYFTQNKQQ